MNLNLNGIDLPTNATDIHPTKGGAILIGSQIIVSLPVKPKRYLYSGWQSWSLTAWIDIDQPIRPMRPSSMRPMQTDPVYALELNPHGSWYGAVELPDGKILFIGALGLESHVRLDGINLTGWYEVTNRKLDDPNTTERASKEWFLALGDETEIFVEYAQLLKGKLGTGRALDSHRVWCSWYSLYTEIYETRLLKILDDLGDLPFDIFQVDDGWQISLGDWEANGKFPSGMGKLADRIKATGRKAGLWLAPLLVVPSSSIFRQHREWLLRDMNGKLVSAGFNWGERLYALDTTHPAALDWLVAQMRKVRGWGYDYIKLDFLYAGALPGKRNLDVPRETAYRDGLKVIREALGDAFFLTCGAPILPSIGLCDGIRVGPDVAGYWASHRDDNLLMNFAIPGTRNALRTTLNHLWLQPLVHTDPDVAFFCSIQSNLTIQQKSLLQDMAQICDFKATSDIPSWMTDGERSSLRDFLESRPTVQKMSRNSYQISEREVDFGPHIGIPELPNIFTNLLGTILGWLANVQPFMILFDRLGKFSLKRTIKKYPI